MRTVRGWVVFYKETGCCSHLFGANPFAETGHFRNFEWNDHTPFSTLRKAKKAIPHILNAFSLRHFEVALVYLWLEIAQTETDLQSFKRCRSLIAIMRDESIKDEQGGLLYGEIVPETPEANAHPLPCCAYAGNGFKAFRSFQEADYVATEIGRQGQCKATLARVRRHRVIPVEPKSHA